MTKKYNEKKYEYKPFFGLGNFPLLDRNDDVPKNIETLYKDIFFKVDNCAKKWRRKCKKNLS